MMKSIVCGLLGLGLVGCSQSVSDYREQQPVLQPQSFFAGKAEAFGVLHDWAGKQSVRFTAELCGQWQADQGDLYEVFEFSDGRIERRHWRLSVDGQGAIQGRADDVVGIAQGRYAGNTMQWQYQLQLWQDNEPLTVTVDDWLYLVAPGQLINRSTLHKWGAQVGEITLAIRQLDASDTCEHTKTRFEAVPASPPVH